MCIRDSLHLLRVLRGDGGDGARAVHAAARERLQVRLNARAATGVRAGDAQCRAGQLFTSAVSRFRAGKIA